MRKTDEKQINILQETQEINNTKLVDRLLFSLIIYVKKYATRDNKFSEEGDVRDKETKDTRRKQKRAEEQKRGRERRNE